MAASRVVRSLSAALLTLTLLVLLASCIDLGHDTVFGGNLSQTATEPVKPKPFVVGDWAAAQLRDYSSVDARVAATPKSAERSMVTLVDYLTSGMTNDFDRVRAVFMWVAENIAYDGEAFSVRDIQNLDAEEIFLRRKGVCGQYSVLFQRLATMAGLQAVVVTGLSTDYPTEILLGNSNHAWNAVRLAGAWYVLDVTWAAGHLDKNYVFQRTRVDARYFLADPAWFLKSHYPTDFTWQLVEHPISKERFLAMAQEQHSS